jgi:competence protein ComEC
MWKDKPAFFAAAVMAAGFAAARVTDLSPALWAVCSLLCIVAAIAAMLRARRFPAPAYFSCSIPVLLFSASALWYAVRFEFESDHLTKFLHIGHPVRMVCRVADEPVMRNGRMQVVVNVMALEHEGDSIDVDGNALLTVVQDQPERAFPAPGRTTPEEIRVRKLAPVSTTQKTNGRREPFPRDTLNFSYGDAIQFSAMLEEPQETRNPGEVSYRDYLALNNVYGVMRVRGFHAITVIGRRTPDWLFDRCVFPARHFVAHAIYSASTGDEGRYLAGLLLGDRSDLSKEIQQAFANTGTIHVLAVSGSHVVVIVAAIYALFGILRIPSRPKICATIAAIFFYMLLTGAAPSVVRATLMTAVVLGGKLLQRRSSVYNCLGASAMLMFLYDPKQVFDVGFQLSFAAVFSMVFFYPRMTAWTSVIPRTTRIGRAALAAAELTAVSAAAQIGTIPFTAYYFEKVSLISLFANLFVVPLAGLNITIGFVSILFSAVSSWIGSCFTEVNIVLAHCVLGVVKASNQIPFAIVHTATFGAGDTLMYAVTAAMVFNLSRPAVFRRLFLMLFFAIDCLLIANAVSSSPRLMRVTFFDVGQGDAALVEFPGDRSLLIDAGPRSPVYDAGEKVLAPGLRRLHVNRLSALLITHPHDDHIGGMPAVLSEIGAERVIVSSVPELKAVMQKDTAFGMPGTMQQARMGGMLMVHSDARIYVLSPQPAEARATDSAGSSAALNDSSVVIRICYGRISFLFMGDAERGTERVIIDRFGDFLHSSVIKIGHHGSGTSSSDELLRAAAPEEAVISVGRFNAFRHPSPVTLRRLRQQGVTIHRTDREGAVVFETDGTQIRRSRWREDARMRGILR